MQFPGPDLIAATLLRRYKRFLADVELADGRQLTVHCPNTGAMTGCAEPGSRVWLSLSDVKTRKYPHSWELVETEGGMACIHSARANAVVEEAIKVGKIPALAGYSGLKRELKYGQGSRADLVLSGGPDDASCTIEVKSVTLLRDAGVGVFPDAVSERARKHLQELTGLAREGERAVIFFCVFHEGIQQVQPAFDIDPAYCEALQQALSAGVEAMAWRASIAPSGLHLQQELPVNSDQLLC
ncbi:MAG: DNA/RNA nuclease SfsA [Halieaceae bacterium]